MTLAHSLAMWAGCLQYAAAVLRMTFSIVEHSAANNGGAGTGKKSLEILVYKRCATDAEVLMLTTMSTQSICRSQEDWQSVDSPANLYPMQTDTNAMCGEVH